MNEKIVAIGEVLWDMLPTGAQLGGAPANFAVHARRLGAQSALVTRVGADELGRNATERLRSAGLPVECVQTDTTAPTGTVSVSLSEEGQPSYTIHEGVAWDRIEATSAAVELVRAADAVCFGSLAQRARASRGAIRRLLTSVPSDGLRLFDINLRQDWYTREVVEESLRLASALKLNDEELPVVAGMFGLTGSVREQVARLATDFGLSLVALTRGAEGSLLWGNQRWSHYPGQAAAVADTVGAGDSFTASLVVGWLRGMDLDELNEAANRVAAYVCSRQGATPELPAALCELFRR